jgi:LuxR family maltose regulon positive regulatory protein
MPVPILATKLYIPPAPSRVVFRPHLIERLNEGLARGLVTLISAPAGFGKTTIVSEWISGCERSVAWLSLDEGDNDPARFLTYFAAALQTIQENTGAKVLKALQSPQPPSVESILTDLVNEITKIHDNFILVLDDYHLVDSKPVDNALNFLLDHLPPRMHLVITTREDPDLPLARLRARGQLTELRAADLRFTESEAAEFLNQVMGLKLSPENIAALEARTEGWIAGLQLAAVSMQGNKDTNDFIESFTGSHRFVMDYLVEEVLKRLSENVQTFLLRTSILDRICGPLCDAVLLDESASSQETLEFLERANLFIIPLDNERRWYRYHHLFADLLRQRFYQSVVSSKKDVEHRVNELHIRASQWLEDNGLELEAFQHAAAANDIERAERLIEGRGIPLHLRGAVTMILNWFASLPPNVLNERPSLWWRYASLLLVRGQSTGVKEKLDAAEDALAAKLQGGEADDKSRNLIGRIAAARATLALTRYDSETMILQSRRALEYLDPDNVTTRANAYWTLGFAYLFQGNRVAARRSLTEAISLSQASEATFTRILATLGLGNLQEADNQLHLAAETYRQILHIAGDQPLQIIGEVHLGLARVLYEWNDLDAAQEHGGQSLQLEQQYDRVIDRFIVCEVFLARVKLARGDVSGAASVLAKASESAHQKNFIHRIPEVVAAQVVTLLREGNIPAASHLAETNNFPLSRARVLLAQGDTSSALMILEQLFQQAKEKSWEDERLKIMVLQAVALHLQSETAKAVQLLHEALILAESGGFIRLFLDEGLPMAELLSEASTQGLMPGYVHKLLAAFEKEKRKDGEGSVSPSPQPLLEPLSQRELEVLRLIAQGLSNHEISERLFLALDTVKGHNRRIFDKLQVQRRTEAVARAHELGLL